jgi:hypothetical protein
MDSDAVIQREHGVAAEQLRAGGVALESVDERGHCHFE